MSRHCFSIPQDATVRLSGTTGPADSNAFDTLSKAVATVQGVMTFASGETLECSIEIPGDEAAQSAFRLMASEILQAYEFSCPD